MLMVLLMLMVMVMWMVMVFLVRGKSKKSNAFRRGANNHIDLNKMKTPSELNAKHFPFTILVQCFKLMIK